MYLNGAVDLFERYECAREGRGTVCIRYKVVIDDIMQLTYLIFEQIFKLRGYIDLFKRYKAARELLQETETGGP